MDPLSTSPLLQQFLTERRFLKNVTLDLIRFGGHLPKGGYDVPNGGYEKPTASSAVHG